MKALKRWWSRLTLPQAVAFGCGVLALYLVRDHLPHDPDTAKEWLEVLAGGLTTVATVGALLHGREARPPEAP